MLTTERLTGRLAAEITSPDLDGLLRRENAEPLRAALFEHHVLVIRDAQPTPEQHLALARIFGEPEPPESYNPAHPDHPDICVFDSEGGYRADQWHADVTWRDTIPLGAVLVMRKAPSSGGDTLWANAHAAYDDLSNGMKQLLEGRRARHDISPDHGTEHPVVATHPETGRKLLFVNRVFTRTITNLPPPEGDAILAFLLDHVARPEYTYRHRWTEGDMVIWDNQATQHYAVSDFDEPRTVHRVSIAGTAPVS